MKKSYLYYFLLVLIILGALIIRLLNLDKASGLWYDEAVIYTQASQAFPIGIIKACLGQDVHFPAYQLMLSLWMKLLGNADTVLRLFSVLCSVLMVVVGFFAGKELKDTKTGLVCASLLAVNSFLIYYSQEVKFYSLIAFLALLSTYFTLRIKNYNKVRDYVFLSAVNVLLFYTFTIGFIFVFWQSLIFFLYLLIHQKEKLKKYSISLVATTLLCLPLVVYVDLNLKRYLATTDVFYYDANFVFVLLQNWFTPKLAALFNNPKSYFPGLSIANLVIIFIPVGLYFVLIVKAIRERSYAIVIFLFSLCFVLTEFLLAAFTNFSLVSRYTIMSLPLVILVASYGVTCLKDKKSKAILSFLIILNLVYLLLVPTSAPRLGRPSGYKMPAGIINKYETSKQSVIIFPIRTGLMDKYLNIEIKKVSFLSFFTQDFLIDKKGKNPHEQSKKYLQNDYPKALDEYVITEIIAKIPKGDYLFIVIDRNFNIYPQEILKKVTEEDSLYYKQPLLFMKLSKITNDTAMICNNHMRFLSMYDVGEWRVVIFQKN